MIPRLPLLAFLALSSLLLTACEDDPILQPQQQGKPTGGSYSRISIDSIGPVNGLLFDRHINPERF